MFYNTNLKKVSMKNWKIPEEFTNVIGCRTSSLCSQNLDYIDVTGWDLSAARNISGLFVNSKTKEIKGLNTWNTSNITDMSYLFNYLLNVESLDTSSFNTANVTNMYGMFMDVPKLKKVNLSLK